MSAKTKVVASVGCVLLLSIGTAILWKPGDPGSVPIGDGAESRPADATEGRDGPRREAPHVAEAPAIVPKTFVETPDREAAPTPGVIRGQVLDVDRTPAAGVPVALFDLRDGAPHSHARMRTETDDQGRFSLTLPSSLANAIVLVAFKQARRPATLCLDGEPADPVTLVLGEGVAIEGVVRVDGQPPRRSTVGIFLGGSRLQLALHRGRVSADIRHGVAGSFSGGDELWWAGTAFETKLADVDCDTEGRFRIAGLAQGTYRIDATNLFDESGLNLDVRADVTAPATGVELAIATGRLRIRLESSGRTLEGGRVSVMNAEGGSIRTVSADQVEVRVGAGVPLTVEGACAGFAQKSVHVAPLAAGEMRDVTIDLEPAKSASLRLTLRGAEAMGLERVSVRFFSLGQAERGVTSALEDLREQLVAVRSRGDDFVTEHLPLPAGPHVLVVLPHAHDSWILPFERDVDVPANGVLAVTQQVVPGGRVDVAGLDPDGNAVSGDWSLRDRSGIELLSGHVSGPARVGSGWITFSGGLGMAGVPGARIRAGSLRRGAGVVPAGSYELVFDAEGFKTARRTVEVIAGAVTRFEIRAEAAAPR